MMLYLKLFPCFCFDCEKQKIVFELIVNQIVKRIELLVIVRLYCESENNIYLMRNKCLRVSICVCRSVCVENLEKAFGDFDFVFGETVILGKTSQSTQEYRTARRSLTQDHRAMKTQQST